jgi:hypothetical protein
MNTIMKKIIHLSLTLILALSLSSCEDWLDVNVNPDSPTNVVASVSSRLPWIQHYYSYAQGTAGTRASMITGQTSSRLFGGTNGTLPAWDPSYSASTTPYQWWFVGSACNIQDMIDKAEEEEAWHYIGAAHLIHAMGFMLMLDWYGEMPYDEALSSSLTPKYATGQEIFEGCMERLDLAIENFQKTQPATATPLSEGDGWNNGDVQKWLKLAYGLKARWLNNLSKKSIYDPQAVLDAIANAPQSNSESTIIHHVNDPSDMTGDILFGDPLKTAYLYDSAAWSDWGRASQWYVDLLDNTFTGGSEVKDPRGDKLLAWAQFRVPEVDPVTEETTIVKKFVRTKGVDAINSDIRLNSGPVYASYNADTKKWSVSSTNPDRQGDTVYIGYRVLCAMTGATSSESTPTASDGTVLTTGTFYTRPESPTDVLTYHEMCFIKAEVLFRQNRKAEALQAYQDGIRAHMEHMNSKLNEYDSSINPAKAPMAQADIEAFLDSDAVAQSVGELTMAKIMQQKFIAMSFHQQNWNDMRRFNYSAGNIADFGVVYPDIDRPREFSASSSTKFPGSAKTDVNYWYRRMAQCSHERNYNEANMRESNPKAFDDDIWSVPVWWDQE